MGWTGLHRKSGQSDLEFFRREFQHGVHRPGYGTFEILDAMTKNWTCYRACRRVGEDGQPEPVFALVVPINRQGNGGMFSYKDQDETCGPCETDCPERILNRLDPLPDCGHAQPTACGTCWAKQWREQCRQNIATRKIAHPVRVGQKFRLQSPLKFADGQSFDTFTLAKSARYRNVARASNGRLYRLPEHWRSCIAEVLA
jgi:hypothetical protein